MIKITKTLVILGCFVLFSCFIRNVAAAELYFSDEFNSIDSSVWDIFGQLSDNSNYVKIVNSNLLISSPNGVYTSYIRSKQNLFPETGDFSAQIKFKYPELTSAGTGIVIGDSNPDYPVDFSDPVNSRIITIWQDLVSPLMGLHNWTFFPQLLTSTTKDPHIIEIKYVNGLYYFYLDSLLKYSALSADRRATSIWMGNPGPAVSSQPWSQLLIDYIRVYSISSSSDFTVSSNWDDKGGQVPIDRDAGITVKVTDAGGGGIANTLVTAEVLNSGVGTLNQTSSSTVENGEAYFIFTPTVASPAHFRFTVNGVQKQFDLNVYRPPVVIVPGMGASLNLPKFLQNAPLSDAFWSWSPTAQDGWDDVVAALQANGYSPNSGYAIAFYDWRKTLDPDEYSSSVPDAIQYGMLPAINRVLQDRPDGQQVNILAHSFGGVVSRAFLKYDSDNRVNRLITLGTPHQGSSNMYYVWFGGTMPPTGDPAFRVVVDSILKIYKNKNIFQNLEGLRSAFSGFRNLLPVYNEYVQAPSFAFQTNSLSQVNDVLERTYRLNELKDVVRDRNIAFTAFYAEGEPTLRNVSVADPIAGAVEWLDGKPLSHQIYSTGDNSVPSESGWIEDLPTVKLEGAHGDVPDLALGRIKELLKIGNSNTVGKKSAKNMLGAVMLSPANVSILSPQGTVLGTSALWDPDAGTKFAYATDLAPGVYSLRVVGTGNGEYTLYVPFAGPEVFSSTEFSGTTTIGKVENFPLYIDTRADGGASRLMKADLDLKIGALNIPRRVLPVSFEFEVPKKLNLDHLRFDELVVNEKYIPILSYKKNKNQKKVEVTVNGAAVGQAINWNERELVVEAVLLGEESGLIGEKRVKINWGLYRKFF